MIEIKSLTFADFGKDVVIQREGREKIFGKIAAFSYDSIYVNLPSGTQRLCEPKDLYWPTFDDLVKPEHLTINLYAYTSEDNNYEKGEEIGLSGEALSLFRHSHEHKMTYKVNPETGQTELIAVDGRELAAAKN